MTIHRFAVTVPNPSAQNVSVQLRLEAAKHTDFSWLRHEGLKTSLKVINSGIVLDPCAKEGKTDLKLKLEPFASVDVYIVINTTPSRKPGIAAFHLVDRRKGKVAGGVFLVCANPPFTEPPSQIVSTPNPCPAALATDLYTILPGNDPSKTSGANFILAGDTMEIVAQITNPTAQPLKHAQVYLEHLGGSNAEFTPGTWNMGVLARGDVFYATWSIRTTAWQVGSFNVCLVVVSEGMDPVRLNGTIKLARGQRADRSENI